MKTLEKYWQKSFDKSAIKGKEDFEITQQLPGSLRQNFAFFISEICNKYLCNTMNVLDMGCGPGTYSEILDLKGHHVSGIDFSREMIKKAISRNRKISYVVGDARSLPYKAASFDMVMNIAMLQCIQNEEEIIEEIKRILVRNRGILVIATLNCFEIFSAKARIVTMFTKPSLRRFNPFNLRKVICAHGFRDIKIFSIFVFPPRLFFLEKFSAKLNRFPFVPLLWAHYFFIVGVKN